MKLVQCWADGVTTDAQPVEIFRRHGATDFASVKPAPCVEHRQRSQAEIDATLKGNKNSTFALQAARVADAAPRPPRAMRIGQRDKKCRQVIHLARLQRLCRQCRGR